ncbi:hypothetical protein [Rhodohalobacter sp.]|uniref:hypothetical protein n=1 Tax=Rhodohalobacter sp. TaxID=1974210 RepID=UPI002ACE7D8C|nr:hypothetical protein [Rhodohalobacter sp.]MDZ7755505.1 hypothetical protein [Rhodohalobacter sp.]
MELLEKIKRHIPTYLNPETKKQLFDELKSFPDNIDQRIYSSQEKLSDTIIYQGDIIKRQPIVFLPDINVKERRVFIISNTCDVDLNNPRPIPNRITYCPIIDLSAYANIVKRSNHFSTDEGISSHIESIKKQRVTSMFYLPEHGVYKESIVLFDSATSLNLDEKRKQGMLENRGLKLGNYGFYLFLIKLSIHFTRIEENVDRT